MKLRIHRRIGKTIEPTLRSRTTRNIGQRGYLGPNPSITARVNGVDKFVDQAKDLVEDNLSIMVGCLAKRKGDLMQQTIGDRHRRSRDLVPRKAMTSYLRSGRPEIIYSSKVTIPKMSPSLSLLIASTQLLLNASRGRFSAVISSLWSIFSRADIPM